MDLNGKIVAVHTIPYPNSNPHGLTVASNGNVWFTGREGNIVGYYDPTTNGFRIFPLPNPDPNPNLEQNGNFPIYITQPPTVDVFHRPADQQRGPDHAYRAADVLPAPVEIWSPGQRTPDRRGRPADGVAVVTEESGHAYATITPDGKVTEYPLTPSYAEAAALTYDTAGTLWNQYNTPDAIAEVQPNGSVTPYPIPTLDAVQHRITVGPDGSLWFTELHADKIGHMVTGHADGPPIDGVYSQSFQAKHGAIAETAAFKQGHATYDAPFKQTGTAKATNAGQKSKAIIDFDENLQGDINRLSGPVPT